MVRTHPPALENTRGAVLEMLAMDTRIDETQIQVDSKDGTITLSGTVTSMNERRFAEEDASSVTGVRAVVNQLAVKYPARAGSPDDRHLETNIMDLIRATTDIDPGRIQVAAVTGILTLEGTVDNFWQKVRIESLAAEIKGVTEIHNHIAVVPTHDIKDEAIAGHITATYSRDIAINEDLINVSVKDGAVTLSGNVPDRVSKRVAVEIAQHTSGVRDVQDNLRIEQSRQD